MNNIKDINNYCPSKEISFFFDANIWLGIFFPIADYNKKMYKIYSQFLNNLIKSNNRICISSLILSEIINYYLRFDFNILKSEKPEVYKVFKHDYRNTKIYVKTMSTIVDIINRQIMKLSNRISDQFDSINLKKLFNNIENSDFNDNYIINLVKKNKLTLVTHDRDFKNSTLKIPIITANKKLLGLK